LSDEQGCTNANPPSKTPVFPLGPWCIAKIESYFQERKCARQKEQPQDLFARRTANATVAIAGLAVIAAFIGYFQYRSMQGQLGAMQGQLDEMRAQRLMNISQTRADLVRDIVAHAVKEGRILAVPGDNIIEYAFSSLWTNTGATAALAWRGWFDLQAFDIGKKPRMLTASDCPALATPNPLPPEIVIVRTGRTTQLAKLISFSDLAATLGANATKFVLMWGHMQYQDIFSPRRHCIPMIGVFLLLLLQEQAFSYITLSDIAK
jgi:hypothetical protein